MTEHVTGLTQLVNHYLGHFALALLSWFHIASENPETPIPEHVVMGLFVLIVGTLLALLLRWRLSASRGIVAYQSAWVWEQGFAGRKCRARRVAIRALGRLDFRIHPAGQSFQCFPAFRGADRQRQRPLGVRDSYVHIFQLAGNPASRPYCLRQAFRGPRSTAFPAYLSRRDHQHLRSCALAHCPSVG